MTSLILLVCIAFLLHAWFVNRDGESLLGKAHVERPAEPSTRRTNHRPRPGYSPSSNGVRR